MDDTENNRGSVWHRWDPHIHVPGTLLNDQYSGADPWADFESKLATSTPKISALGITDYFTLASYETAVKRQEAAPERWPALLFPNVEMRFGLETAKLAAINVHLLCDPRDTDHVTQIKRFLSHLTFPFKGETYRCADADLARLGRVHSPGQELLEQNARQIGANQFKVAFKDLIAAFDASEWARRNILVAIAGGGRDGTSSLKEDTSFSAMRVEMEARADIIFSAQKQQREFWLGHGPATLEQLRTKWRGCKPCLHGSDAHDLAHVGEPDLTRFCWIKGDRSFESLKQACIEPEARVYIGATPPRGALESQTITRVSVAKADWFPSSAIDLNPGLVAIIGARGSGKTALADLIATGAYSASPDTNDRSFLHRAREFFGDEEVTLDWASQEKTSSAISLAGIGDMLDTRRVRYLSQQFVEKLCSAEGATDELVEEIERVVFSAYPQHDRLGATTFAELLEIRCEQARRSRSRNERSLITTTDVLNAERQKHALLPALKKQHEELTVSLKKDRVERSGLIGKASDENSQLLQTVSLAAETVRSNVDAAKRKLHALTLLKDDVADLRKRTAPDRLRHLKSQYGEAALTDEQWSTFDIDYKGDVDTLLASQLVAATSHLRSIEGPASGEPELKSGSVGNASLLPSGTDPASLTLSLLEKERARLQALAGIDAQNAKQIARLSEKIVRDEAALAKRAEAVTDAEGSPARIEALLNERSVAYRGIFEAITAEQSELTDLYAPLTMQLADQVGALAKLGFSVRRIVNAEGWASTGERLLDLRKAGPFRGKGTLLQAAHGTLVKAWRAGDAKDVAEAMSVFRREHERALIEHMPDDVRGSEQRRDWGAKVAKWLYDTNHIRLSYGIQYDGVDIEQLSPGTRGIVLLLLYLAIDVDDDRPIIIDQPEENLDPKSVHDELVARFRAARSTRQIIIVTHNANLVVNTDADQVIVASCGPHRPGQLPEMSYLSGGLENPGIRQQVCEILEGGEAAFRERAKRLRLTID